MGGRRPGPGLNNYNLMNMVPFLSVYKQGQLIDSICLQDKDTWIVGRHVDCDIHVAHASASRHHLEIQVLHATMELLLTDLQSGNVKDFLMRERRRERARQCFSADFERFLSERERERES